MEFNATFRDALHLHILVCFPIISKNNRNLKKKLQEKKKCEKYIFNFWEV